MTGLNHVIIGDALTELRRLPAGSMDCCITSPPYYRLRNYQAAGQIGMEPTVDGWVEALRMVCGEVGRILTPTGSLWLNLGDSYSRGAASGTPAKSLLLGPERLARALVDDGWLLRNKVVWAKPNPMPTSVNDRLNTTYEVIYFLVRSPRYYFDLDAIRLPHRSRRPSSRRVSNSPTDRPDWSGPLAGSNSGLDRLKARGQVGHPLGKNPGDVWQVATGPSRHGHHATFPERLIERPIRASCPARACMACGRPWRRQAAERLGHLAVMGELEPGCTCGRAWRAGIVLDPFVGSGTTAVVAERLGRDWLGIELRPEFAALAERRTADARRSLRNAA